MSNRNPPHAQTRGQPGFYHSADYRSSPTYSQQRPQNPSHALPSTNRQQSLPVTAYTQRMSLMNPQPEKSNSYDSNLGSPEHILSVEDQSHKARLIKFNAGSHGGKGTGGGGKGAGLSSRQQEPDSSDGDSDGEASGSSNKTRKTRARHACLVLLAGCTAYFMILFFMVWLPWGRPPYNTRLQEDLEEFAAAGIRFKRVCWFKQNNACRLPFWCHDNIADDVAGWYHHEGILIEMVNGDGYPAGYLMFNYGYYGLKFAVQHTPLMSRILPFNSTCRYRCGDIPPGNDGPKRLMDQFESERYQPYNGFRFNCFQFAEMIWLHFSPRTERCGPEHLPPRASLPPGVRLHFW